MTDAGAQIPFECVRDRRFAGFSIIELMIVLGIVGVLAAIALPSYEFWIKGARRADGTTALLDLANRMQRYYSENNTFATATIAAGAATDVLPSATSPQGYYTITFVSGTLLANSYTIKATRAGVQASDTRCGDLTLTSANVRGIVTAGSGITWDQCW